MVTESKTWLYDILIAIDEIEIFVADQSTGPRSQQADLKTRRAIERNFVIIGEAVSKIMQTDESVKLSNSRKIVDTRNRIMHDYYGISDDIIQSIILQYLPVLKSEVEKLLKE